MRVTTRFAHQAERPGYEKGKTFHKGDLIGYMGSTGLSTAAHCHIDNSEGSRDKNWKLADAESGKVKPVPRQLNRFIHEDLFGGSIRVTTPYADFRYQLDWKKLHLAYDVSTDQPAPWPMYWPIEEEGRCEAVIYDNAYGWTSLLSYEVKEQT